MWKIIIAVANDNFLEFIYVYIHPCAIAVQCQKVDISNLFVKSERLTENNRDNLAKN